MFSTKKSPAQSQLSARRTTSTKRVMSEAAEEKAFKIKCAQEQALQHLPLNALYVVLYIRSDPPVEGEFRWGYYIHNHPSGGIKYCIQAPDSGQMTDHTPTASIFKSNLLCVIIEIAKVPQARHGLIDQTVRSFDGKTSGISGMGSRVWFSSVLSELVQRGLVQCSNIDSLVEECAEIGNRYMDDASQNKQPRPVVRASCSG